MPLVKQLDSSRHIADVQILTRMLCEIVDAMLAESPAQLYIALQRMKVYCDNFQRDLRPKKKQ